MIQLQKTITPKQVAERYGCKPDTVIAWIRSGELRAIDVSSRSSTRPRFRVDPVDLEIFENRRSVQAAPKTQRRRRRKNQSVTEYF